MDFQRWVDLSLNLSSTTFSLHEYMSQCDDFSEVILTFAFHPSSSYVAQDFIIWELIKPYDLELQEKHAFFSWLRLAMDRRTITSVDNVSGCIALMKEWVDPLRQ